MIDARQLDDSRYRLVVQGNQSMSWRANVWLALSLGGVSMGIALALASFGLWMVIPFAGAELVLVLLCLHVTLRRLGQKEVITVDAEAIRLEWGYEAPEKSVNLPRQWTRLSYHCDDSPFDVGRLSMAAHGKCYSLGRALGRDEKRVLYVELDSVLRQRTYAAPA